MIARLFGKVIEKSANWVIVDAGGVGYKVFCATDRIDDSENLTLFTHHHIRENEQTLYGFATLKELELFELLITVNGVGPKAAMAIMAGAKPEKIIAAIAEGDTSLFKSISGIGQKVAAKIIVELKSKIGDGGDFDLAGLEKSNDVIDALETLGYKRVEIASTLRAMPSDLKDTSAQLTWALKEMGKRK